MDCTTCSPIASRSCSTWRSIGTYAGRSKATWPPRRLAALRMEMAKYWRAEVPWRARDALDVIAILDMPAWAALLGLIDECPVIHAGLGASRGSGTRAVSAS